MNIWYLSAHDQPKGHSSRTYDFARELVKRGHQVTMFTNSYCHWTHVDILKPHEKWRVDTVDDIRIIWLKTIPYSGNGWLRGLNMLSNVWRSIHVARLLQDKPDVVIGPSVPPGTGWAAAYIAKMKRAAFVFEVRDVWPIRLVYDGGMSKKSPIYMLFRLLEKYLYHKAHKISTAVPFIHEHVADSGSDPKKIQWIPNGIDFNRFLGFEHYKAQEKNTLVVMYIGGVGPKHGVSTIIQAASILQQRGNTDFNFIIIGNGSKRLDYEREAMQIGLTNIEFRGAVPKSEVPRIQTEADILIASVLDSEAYRFGINFNKLFDYFSSSRPVVLACNAPNDPVAASGAGFSVPPEDPHAMAEALEKIQRLTVLERVEMGKLGRAYVENEFDIRTLAMNMESLLLEAIKTREAVNAT